jgi:hypothetical protein
LTASPPLLDSIVVVIIPSATLFSPPKKFKVFSSTSSLCRNSMNNSNDLDSQKTSGRPIVAGVVASTKEEEEKINKRVSSLVP